MKTITLSNRFYYRELSVEDTKCIKHDLMLYNSMLHYAYKKLYEIQFYHVKMDMSLQKHLKEKYETNDYFPLSVINEAKGILKSNIKTNQRLRKLTRKRIVSIKAKINETEKKIEYYEKQKHKMIQKCKAMDYTNDDYLYEVQVITPALKKWKHHRAMLVFRLHKEEYHLLGLEKKVKGCCFGSRKKLNRDKEAFIYERRKRMLIPGRRQGKYSNNLFKYHTRENKMVYRSTQKDIILPITFHHHKEALERAVQLPHNTAKKAVAYELYDHGEYFIIKAIVTLEEKKSITSTHKGSIGIDINVDHIALSIINQEANLVGSKVYPMKVKGKTMNQRKHIQYHIIKEIIEECVESKKSLVIEDLDFEDKKMKMLYKDKRRNEMLSHFAYAQLIEKIERKAYYEGVENI